MNLNLKKYWAKNKADKDSILEMKEHVRYLEKGSKKEIEKKQSIFKILWENRHNLPGLLQTLHEKRKSTINWDKEVEKYIRILQNKEEWIYLHPEPEEGMIYKVGSFQGLTVRVQIGKKYLNGEWKSWIGYNGTSYIIEEEL